MLFLRKTFVSENLNRGDFLLCDKCNINPATVHVERMVNNSVSTQKLCFSCAVKEGADMSFENMVKELLGSVIGTLGNNYGEITFPIPGHIPGQAVPFETIATCEFCGLSYSELREEGKLGCADCYQIFRPKIDVILKNIHGSSEHLGKVPVKAPKELLLRREIDELRRLQAEAIEREDFEKAADLRDKIRKAEADASLNQE